MSFEYKGKVYRDLMEQVGKNKSDIENLIKNGGLLSQRGINIVGKVNAASDLPDARQYIGEYGDAYLVGVNKPYDYYIYTQPIGTALYPQWFNIGPFPAPGVAGPEGAEGPAGPQGTRGGIWYYGSSYPGINDNLYVEGDMFIVTTTNAVYNYRKGSPSSWRYVMKLEGAQGPAGPAGPAGPQGTRGGTWFYGAQLPNTTQGYINGDMFVSQTTKEVFINDDGAWTYLFKLEGAEGAEGPAGPQGIRGGTWFYGAQLPNTTQGYINGDMFVIQTTKEVYINNNNIWSFLFVLEGAAGPAGPAGPQGDPGPQGPPYTLTTEDKNTITNSVIQALTTVNLTLYDESGSETFNLVVNPNA